MAGWLLPNVQQLHRHHTVHLRIRIKIVSFCAHNSQLSAQSSALESTAALLLIQLHIHNCFLVMMLCARIERIVTLFYF